MKVAQSCPAVCDPMDCSPPGSSVHGILQARILEWAAISSSRRSSQPRDQTQVSCVAGRLILYCLSHQGMGQSRVGPAYSIQLKISLSSTYCTHHWAALPSSSGGWKPDSAFAGEPGWQRQEHPPLLFSCFWFKLPVDSVPLAGVTHCALRDACACGHTDWKPESQQHPTASLPSGPPFVPPWLLLLSCLDGLYVPWQLPISQTFAFSLISRSGAALVSDCLDFSPWPLTSPFFFLKEWAEPGVAQLQGRIPTVFWWKASPAGLPWDAEFTVPSELGHSCTVIAAVLQSGKSGEASWEIFFSPYIFSLAYFSVATLFSFFLVTALLVFLGLVIIEAAPLSE